MVKIMVSAEGDPLCANTFRGPFGFGQFNLELLEPFPTVMMIGPLGDVHMSGVRFNKH